MLARPSAIPTQPAAAERAVVFAALVLALAAAGCGSYVPGTMPSTRVIAQDAAWDGDAAVSPDGKSVAFVSDRSDNARGLWVRPADGKGEPRLLASGLFDVSRPTWSVDGKSIVFTRVDPATGLGRPYLAEVAAGSATPIHLVDSSRDVRDCVRAPEASAAAVVRTDSTVGLVAVSATARSGPCSTPGPARPRLTRRGRRRASVSPTNGTAISGGCTSAGARPSA